MVLRLGKMLWSCFCMSWLVWKLGLWISRCLSSQFEELYDISTIFGTFDARNSHSCLGSEFLWESEEGIKICIGPLLHCLSLQLLRVEHAPRGNALSIDPSHCFCMASHAQLFEEYLTSRGIPFWFIAELFSLLLIFHFPILLRLRRHLACDYLNYIMVISLTNG